MENLKEAIEAISTTNPVDQSELRKQIFEFELSRCLFKSTTELTKKIKEFHFPESESVMEARIRLNLAYVSLGTLNPHTFVSSAARNFLLFVSEEINRVVRNDDLIKAFRLLEVELYILAAFKLYEFNDQGEEEPDPQTSYIRFINGVNKYLRPLYKKGDHLDEVTVLRNLRIDDAVAIFEDGVLYEDRFETFFRTVNSNFIIESCQKLAIETQIARFGEYKIPILSLIKNVRLTAPQSTALLASNIERIEKEQNVVQLEKKEQQSPEEKKTPIMKVKPSTTVTPKSQKQDSPQPQRKRQFKRLFEETQDDNVGESTTSRSISGKTGRMRFTPEEDEALREGVKKYGVSKWKAILLDSKFSHIFQSVKPRTAENLKDRWRNLSK